MGGGKPLRAWGGRPLLAQALDLARSYAPDVAVAVRDAGQAGRGAGIPLLFDPPDIGGPLAGLASAPDFGRRHGAAWVQILACDMPYLPVDLSDRLARALGAGVGGPAGERWPPASGLRPLARRIARAAGGLSGDGSLVAARLPEHVGLREVAWEVAGPDPFINLNTLEDLAAYQPSRVIPGLALADRSGARRR